MLWTIERGNTPIVVTAIHNGHKVRQEVADIMAIDEDDRLREEDPYMDRFTDISDSSITVFTSRFEMDLNRPPEKAIYKLPEDAWGLNVWLQDLPEAIAEKSMLNYNRFYREAFAMFKHLETKYGRFVVLDLHSYCHRRNGSKNPPADAQDNPDINVGTGTMDRSRWENIVDGFISDLRNQPFQNRFLDVRENIRFRGGWFSQWIHKTFPDSGCAIAVEVKKIFMDEWTGLIDESAFEEIKRALKATMPGILEHLDSVK